MAYSYSLLSDAELLRALNNPAAALDDQMKDALYAASQEIQDQLGRVIIQTSWIEYHEASDVEPAILRVLHWPIASITEIAEDSSRGYGSSTTLTENTDYIVDTGTDESARIIRIRGGYRSSWLSGFEAVRIKFSGGWTQANVPPAVKSICGQYASRIWMATKQQSHAYQSVNNELGTVTSYGPVMLTKPMRARISDYKDFGATTAVRWEVSS